MSRRFEQLLTDVAEGARDLGLRDLAVDLDRFVTAERSRFKGDPPNDEPLVRRLLQALEPRP